MCPPLCKVKKRKSICGEVAAARKWWEMCAKMEDDLEWKREEQVEARTWKGTLKEVEESR